MWAHLFWASGSCHRGYPWKRLHCVAVATSDPKWLLIGLYCTSRFKLTQYSYFIGGCSDRNSRMIWLLQEQIKRHAIIGHNPGYIGNVFLFYCMNNNVRLWNPFIKYISVQYLCRVMCVYPNGKCLFISRHFCCKPNSSIILVKLPWIFSGAHLIFIGAPGNIQDNLPGMHIISYVSSWILIMLIATCILQLLVCI